MTFHKSDAWLSLTRIIANIEADLASMLQVRYGLGLSEYRALDILARSQNSELRMQELATHLCLNQSSVSRLVERLERAGFTVRDLCPDDKRGVYTVLTKDGCARFESAQPDYEKALEDAIKKHGGEQLLPSKIGGAINNNFEPC